MESGKRKYSKMECGKHRNHHKKQLKKTFTRLCANSTETGYSYQHSYSLNSSKLSSKYKPKKKDLIEALIKKKEFSKLKELNMKSNLHKLKYHQRQFIKITKPFPESRSIRYLDYCFPYGDVSYKISDDNLKSNFLVFFTFEEFKRISKIEIDHDTKIYKYHFEEKYLTPQIWKGINTWNVIENFLLNTEDALAHELIILLKILINKIEGGWIMTQNFQFTSQKTHTWDALVGQVLQNPVG